MASSSHKKEPKILIFDIETSLMEAWIWSTGDQYIGHIDIKKDWHLMCFAAKWYKRRKIYCMSQRNAKVLSDDRKLLKYISDLLNQADLIMTKNGIKFDFKKINARLVLMKIKPIKHLEHIDTEKMSRGNFAFTSNSLEYLGENVNEKNKKSKHKKFIGKELWIQCTAGNSKAWDEMEKYNIKDVLATEELYTKLAPYCDVKVNLNAYRAGANYTCQCGSNRLQWRGHNIKGYGKYRRFQCQDCGKWGAEKGYKNNLFEKEKIKSLKGK